MANEDAPRSGGKEAANGGTPADAAASFQPIVDLRSDRPIGWIVRAPGLPRAEVLAAVSAAGPPPPDSVVFVPAAPRDLTDPAFLESCRRTGGRVVLELSGVELAAKPPALSTLDALADAGIHVGITDPTALGLAELSRIAPSFVIIGSDVLDVVTHDDAARGIVRAQVTYADQDDVYVLADGVVGRAQIEELRRLGVVFVAGPHYGPPATTWAPPRVRRSRPRLDLDPERRFRRVLAAATTAEEVADLLCEHLVRIGVSPAVYLENAGVLRCVAHRGQTLIRDGVPIRAGVLGRVFRSGNTRTVVTAEPDDELPSLHAPIQLVLPIRLEERVVGVLDLALDEAASSREEDQYEAAVRAAEARFADVGHGRPQTSVHRLVRANNELAELGEARQVETAATRLACSVGGMSSALFALPRSRDDLEVAAVQGPLTAELRSLSTKDMLALLSEIDGAWSSFSTGEDDLPPSVVGQLRASGASTIAVFPVFSNERGTGLLVVADHAPVPLGPDTREALELLAREIGRTLDMTQVMDDLRKRATVDPLTGLGNLAAFQDSLTAIGGRRRGRWAVVMADVDGLKRVNDTHGHLTGDLALRRLATAIDGVLRQGDRMFRIGGDEFAALLHDVDAEGAEDIGQRMCDAAAAVMSEFGAGLSVGIAIPEPGEPANDFIDRADKVLYEVKRNARGTARVAAAVDPG